MREITENIKKCVLFLYHVWPCSNYFSLCTQEFVLVVALGCAQDPYGILGVELVSTTCKCTHHCTIVSTENIFILLKLNLQLTIRRSDISLNESGHSTRYTNILPFPSFQCGHMPAECISLPSSLSALMSSLSSYSLRLSVQ